MSDVPSEVCREILLLLPAESLLRFRRVCKAWRGMIEDPAFIKAHTQNQPYTHTLLVRSRTGAPTFSFSLDSLNAINGPQMIEATPIRQLIGHSLPDLFEVASCNGLILLTHKDKKRNWAIWNPLTRDCHVLPIPSDPTTGASGLCGYGFGYDDDADDYKVVRVTPFYFSPEEDVIRTQIYSLKSESWGAIEQDSPVWIDDWIEDSPVLYEGAFLNGTFYWKSLGYIVALHLGTVSYTQISMPQLENRRMDLDCFSLEALDGFLILSFHDDESHFEGFEGWVMKDEGWNKLFCVEFSEVLHKLKLVAYLKDERQIVAQHDDGFLMFDVDHNYCMKKFSVHGFPCIVSSRICPGSLVRFNASRTLSATTKKKRKSREKLRFCVRDDKEACDLEECRKYCKVLSRMKALGWVI